MCSSDLAFEYEYGFFSDLGELYGNPFRDRDSDIYLHGNDGCRDGYESGNRRSDDDGRNIRAKDDSQGTAVYP